MATNSSTDSGTIWQLVSPYLSKRPFTLVFLLLTGFGIMICNIVMPAFARFFVDRIVIDNDFSWETGLLTGILILLLISGILSYLQGQVLNRLSASTSLL